MKNLNIEALGLQEMTKEEMREVRGGKFFGWGSSEGTDKNGCYTYSAYYVFGIPFGGSKIHHACQ